MAREVDFSTGTIVTDDWLDAQQEVESALALGVRIVRTSNTTIQIPVATDGTVTGQTSARIAGRSRWIVEPLTHSFASPTAMTAATYIVYIVASGLGPSFTLAVTTGAPPANSRKIGEVDWDGAVISAIRNMVDSVPGHAWLHRPGGSDAIDFSTADPMTLTSLSLSRNDKIALALTGSAAGITFGGDTNLYRVGENILMTDDALQVAGGIYALNGFVQASAATEAQYAFNATGGATDAKRWRIRATGSYLRFENVNDAFSASRQVLAIEPYSAGGLPKVWFGDGFDTNLYRSDASVLKTDGHFYAALDLVARVGAATQVAIGQRGPANEAGLVFGSSSDTNLYRPGTASTLKTDGNLRVVGAVGTGRVTVGRSGATTDSLNAYSAGVEAFAFASGIAFMATDSTSVGAYPRIRIDNGGVIRFGSGTADVDVALYRDSVGPSLRTDQPTRFGGSMTFVGVNAVVQRMGQEQPKASQQEFFQFHNATDGQDWSIYREGNARDLLFYSTTAGNALRLAQGGKITAVGEVQALHFRAPGNVYVDSNSVGGGTGIYFGSALDTNLYRPTNTPDTLKTDDKFHAAGNIVLADGLYGIGGVSPGHLQLDSAADHVFRSGSTERVRITSAGTVDASMLTTFNKVRTTHTFYGVYNVSEAGDVGGGSGYANKLYIRNHHGIKYDAFTAGGGHRFYCGYDASAAVTGLYFSVGENETAVRTYVPLIVQGNRVSRSSRREQHTWAISGDVAVASGTTDYIPPMFVDISSGETLTAVRVRQIIQSGTQVTFDLRRRDSSGTETTILSGLAATSSGINSGTASVALTDADRIYPVVTAVAGAPKNLSITVAFDRSSNA